ncbi:MAG: HNH endonuclease [Pseudomonadota bacterium]
MVWILKLDIAGLPLGWLTREQCATLYCLDRVAWEAGAATLCLRGGVSRATGKRSRLDLNTIVATRFRNRNGRKQRDVPALTNARLFQRDRHMCLYCGEVLPPAWLTRDHVIPVARGGRDRWENVVTACRACNQRKGSRLLSELRMKLLAIPYVPNVAEGLILSNRRILADQMAFLKAQVSQESRFRIN